MGEMKYTKRLIKEILETDLRYNFICKESIDNGTLDDNDCAIYSSIKYLAELASKEIEEQEARERGEQK